MEKFEQRCDSCGAVIRHGTIDAAETKSALEDCTLERVRSEVGEVLSDADCAVVREYHKWCNLCGEEIRHGTVSIAKETPGHSFAWRSVGCNQCIWLHTYEAWKMEMK